MTSEGIPTTSPERQRVDAAVQGASPIFDEVAFLGNSLPIPQEIEVVLPGTGLVRIATYPQKFERADHAYVRVDCHDTSGLGAGRIFLQGDKPTATTGEWSWALTSKPGKIEEAPQEVVSLADTFIVQLAEAWNGLDQDAQDRQIDALRASIPDRKSRRIARSLKHLRRPPDAA